MTTIALRTNKETYKNRNKLTEKIVRFFSEHAAEILTSILSLSGQTITTETCLMFKK